MPKKTDKTSIHTHNICNAMLCKGNDITKSRPVSSRNICFYTGKIIRLYSENNLTTLAKIKANFSRVTLNKKEKHSLSCTKK